MHKISPNRINYKCENCGCSLILVDKKTFRNEIDILFKPCLCCENVIDAYDIPSDFNFSEWGNCNECEDLPNLKNKVEELETQVENLQTDIEEFEAKN